MQSQNYVELNSTVYRVDRSRVVRKFCFGYLCSGYANKPDSLAKAIFDSAVLMRRKVAIPFLTSFRIRSLLCRVPLPCSVVPKQYWSVLVKKAWFRQALLREEPDLDHACQVRQIDFVYGPVLRPEWKSRSLSGCVKVIEKIKKIKKVKEWRGRTFPPPDLRIREGSKFEHHRALNRLRLERVPVRRQLWQRDVLALFEEHLPHALMEDPFDLHHDSSLHTGGVLLPESIDEFITSIPVKWELRIAPRFWGPAVERQPGWVKCEGMWGLLG